MKYRYKIALLFTLVCTSIIGGFSSIIFLLVKQHNEIQFQNRLEERAILAGQVVLEKDELTASEYEKITEKQLSKLSAETHFLLKINDDGSLPYEQLPKKFQQNSVFNSLNQHLDIVFKKINKQQVAYLFYDDNQGKYIIVITAKDKNGDEDLLFIKNVLILLTLLTFLIIGLISLLFANKIIQPVRNITSQIQSISANNLSQRLQIKENQDQLYFLSLNFNQLLDRLERSFDDQKQFIQNASHELKTPLTIILAEAEIAKNQDGISPENKISFEKIYIHANKLNQILVALLNLSFIEQNKSLELEVIRFDEAIQEEITYFFKTQPQAKINLNYANQPISENYLECKANKVWLAIVVQNVLKNAYKYSDGKQIELFVEDKASCVEVSIKDQGIGIDSKELPYIGKPFFRAKNAQQKKGQGTGLSLSYKIMQAMEGNIHVSSTIHKGTTICLQLKK